MKVIIVRNQGKDIDTYNIFLEKADGTSCLIAKGLEWHIASTRAHTLADFLDIEIAED